MRNLGEIGTVCRKVAARSPKGGKAKKVRSRERRCASCSAGAGCFLRHDAEPWSFRGSDRSRWTGKPVTCSSSKQNDAGQRQLVITGQLGG